MHDKSLTSSKVLVHGPFLVMVELKNLSWLRRGYSIQMQFHEEDILTLNPCLNLLKLILYPKSLVATLICMCIIPSFPEILLVTC